MIFLNFRHLGSSPLVWSTIPLNPDLDKISSSRGGVAMPLAGGGQDAFPPWRQVEIVWRLWRGEDLELLSRTRCDRAQALPVAEPIPLRGERCGETSPGWLRPYDHAAAPDEAGNRSPLLMPRCGAPDFPLKLVIRIMMNLLTRLTGLGIQVIMGLNYLVSLSPNSPFLGLLLLGSGEAMKRLRHCGQRISDAKNETSR